MSDNFTTVSWCICGKRRLLEERFMPKSIFHLLRVGRRVGWRVGPAK